MPSSPSVWRRRVLDTVTAEGGCCGCYLRSEGAAGNGSLRITVQGMEPIVLYFEVRKETRV